MFRSVNFFPNREFGLPADGSLPLTGCIDAGVFVNSGIQVKNQNRNDGGVPAGYKDPAVVHVTVFIHIDHVGVGITRRTGNPEDVPPRLTRR